MQQNDDFDCIIAYEYLLYGLSETFVFTGWSSQFSQALNAYTEDDKNQRVSQYDVF